MLAFFAMQPSTKHATYLAPVFGNEPGI